jgi:hypothetical protein
MHNRRFGAFLLGAWLIGSVLVWFVSSQSGMNVERTLSTPPQQIQKEFDDMGPEVTRQILRHQAMQLNRRVTETWEMMQLGMAAALLAISILTTHRSITTFVSAILLMIMAAIAAFYLTPAMNGLGRSFDFLPATAAMRERDAFQRLEVWHKVLVVLSTLVALITTARLVFDFYEFRDKVLPGTDTKHKVRRRRRHTVPSPSPVQTALPSSGEAAEPAGQNQRSETSPE